MGVSNLGVSFAMASGPGNEKKSPDVTRIGDEYQQLLHRAVDCSTIQLSAP